MAVANIKDVQPRTTPRLIQQNYYEFLGDATDITWDYYRLPDQRKFLEKKVGFALFGPPNQLPDVEITETSTDLEKLNFQMENGYGTKEVEQINLVCDQIVAQTKYQEDPNDLFMSVVCVVYVPMEEECETLVQLDSFADMNIVSVFRVKKCVPKTGISDDEAALHNYCFIFIDHDSRVYTSWEEYINNNKLPKCKMVVPRNGIYNGNEDDNVLLSEFMSPAFSWLRTAERVGDIASTTVSVGATGVLLVGMIPAAATAMAGAVAVAAVGAGAAGVYSIVRGVTNLVDRSSHDQTIGPQDAEARSSWMSVVGGSMGIVSGAATKALSAAAGRGMVIGEGVRHVVNVINVGSMVVHGASTAYGIYQIYDLWHNEGEAPTPLMIFQVTASVLFFTNSIVNMQTANTIIKDRQNAVLEEYQASLRSNRHRKMFNKMSKQTIREAGDEVIGRAEIIRSINNINNKDDFFAGIARMNKNFNRNNIKISFSPDGTVLMNGQTSVDPMSFWAAGSTYQESIYRDLPPPVLSANGVSAARFQDTSVAVRSWRVGVEATNVLGLAKLIIDLSEKTREGIINTISYYLSSLSKLAVNNFHILLNQFVRLAQDMLGSEIKDLFPLAEKQLMIFFGFAYEYIEKIARNEMQAYKDENRGVLHYMELILLSIIVNGYVEEFIFREMLTDFKKYIENWLARPRRKSITCKKCNGQNYSK